MLFNKKNSMSTEKIYGHLPDLVVTVYSQACSKPVEAHTGGSGISTSLA